MTSHFFAPYVLQPSRPISNTLIDNIFINSDNSNLFQFALLEGFFKDLFHKKVKLYERNLKNFVDREFNVALSKIHWDEILLINENDNNNLIYEHQLGFRSKYSTNHALISTTEWIKSYIDKGNFVGGIVKLTSKRPSIQ